MASETVEGWEIEPETGGEKTYNVATHIEHGWQVWISDFDDLEVSGCACVPLKLIDRLRQLEETDNE